MGQNVQQFYRDDETNIQTYRELIDFVNNRLDSDLA